MLYQTLHEATVSQTEKLENVSILEKHIERASLFKAKVQINSARCGAQASVQALLGSVKYKNILYKLLCMGKENQRKEMPRPIYS